MRVDGVSPLASKLPTFVKLSYSSNSQNGSKKVQSTASSLLLLRDGLANILVLDVEDTTDKVNHLMVQSNAYGYRAA